MPKVSIIIPAYNAMTYLPETVDSVLKQTYNDFEVIVVNDSSTDETEQWVSQIADSRVKLISQENQGAAGARNNGIGHAQGEYIAFLDADDLWEPTKIEKQVHSLDSNPEVGLVYTWVACIDEKGKSKGKMWKNDIEGNVWEKLIEHNIVECGSVAMVRRCCFKTLGMFDQNIRFAEDWEMWIRVATSYTFAVIKKPLVYYRDHRNNKSKKYMRNLSNFRVIVEKSFQSVPIELLYLRNRSYGQINFCIAWKCLQSSDTDYKQAINFRRQALLHCPQLRFSKEYLRLSIAITLMRWFGADCYGKVLTLLDALRRFGSTITRTKQDTTQIKKS
jgi:glycosyltransferase involved in cell wall biosynthesis